MHVPFLCLQAYVLIPVVLTPYYLDLSLLGKQDYDQLETWMYFSTLGLNPRTWQEMETGGVYERTWQDLES